MATLHWREAEERLEPGKWRGLNVDVVAPARAELVVHTCAPRFLRLGTRALPMLWWRIDDGYGGYEMLRARRHESVGVLPPLTTTIVREHAERDDRVRAWTRTFAELLTASAVSPLDRGAWQLRGSEAGLGTGQLEKVLAQRTSSYIDWDFTKDLYPFTLRDPSRADAARVKAWRKVARNGCLPRAPRRRSALGARLAAGHGGRRQSSLVGRVHAPPRPRHDSSLAAAGRPSAMVERSWPRARGAAHRRLRALGARRLSD